jgi:hypothetical protein
MKTVAMKSFYGKYLVFNKTFKDEAHLNNWYRLMSDKGHKIIGIHDIKEA